MASSRKGINESAKKMMNKHYSKYKTANYCNRQYKQKENYHNKENNIIRTIITQWITEGKRIIWNKYAIWRRYLI